MNCNEVLANRANEILGAARGTYQPVHPNDHVNMAQSTNDVIPTAMRLATLATLPHRWPRSTGSPASLLAKGVQFDAIVKSGRTHLQDATPDPAGPGVHRLRPHRRAPSRRRSPRPPTGCAR